MVPHYTPWELPGGTVKVLVTLGDYNPECLGSEFQGFVGDSLLETTLGDGPPGSLGAGKQKSLADCATANLRERCPANLLDGIPEIRRAGVQEIRRRARIQETRRGSSEGSRHGTEETARGCIEETRGAENPRKNANDRERIPHSAVEKLPMKPAKTAQERPGGDWVNKIAAVSRQQLRNKIRRLLVRRENQIEPGRSWVRVSARSCRICRRRHGRTWDRKQVVGKQTEARNSDPGTKYSTRGWYNVGVELVETDLIRRSHRCRSSVGNYCLWRCCRCCRKRCGGNWNRIATIDALEPAGCLSRNCWPLLRYSGCLSLRSLD